MSEDIRKKAVSMLIAGSWHIYSRQTLDESVEYVAGLLERGINEFDIVDYWDCSISNTKRFGEVVKILNIPRDAIKIGIKVFITDQPRIDVLKKEMERLDIDYADRVLFSRPRQGETLDHAIDEMYETLDKGLVKQVEFGMWDPKVALEAVKLMKKRGLPIPKTYQMAYNICRRDVVESEDFEALFAEGVKLSAGLPLEGGLITGHITRMRYDPEDKARGLWFPEGERNITRDAGNIRPMIIKLVPRIKELAESIGLTSAEFATAFVASHPHLENMLFGATKLWQVDETIKGMEYGLEHPQQVRELAEQCRVTGATAPTYFDYGRFNLYKK